MRLTTSLCIALTLASLSFGCGGARESAKIEVDTSSREESGSCPAQLVLDDRTYDQWRPQNDLPRERRLVDVRFPDCFGDEASGEVRGWRIRGIAVDQAFVVRHGDTEFLYVADSVDDPCALPHVDC